MTSPEEPLVERIQSERRFLHDLANPCAVALGLSERLAESLEQALEEGRPVSEKDIQRARKVFSAVSRQRDLIASRREELIALSGEGGASGNSGTS